MRPLLLPTIVILAWVLKHNIKKSKGTDKENVSAYLKREEQANFTRRKDISNLPYIEIPFDRLPLDITLNDKNLQSKIETYREEIYKLSDKKMLNLIGISNLELKENYGPANLELLTIYDGNYSKYIRTLSLFSDCIYGEYPNEAVQISEYLIEIGTDISTTFLLLGKYYIQNNQIDKFHKLYEKIPVADSLAGKVIVQKLDDLKYVNADD